MTSVIAVVIALLVIFLVLVVSLLIAYKKQKLCFQGKRGKGRRVVELTSRQAAPSLKFTRSS